MSGIFGIFNHGGSALDRGALQAMHDVFAQWFDDDRGVWCEGSVGLGHTMLWNTPESKLERLPRYKIVKNRKLAITCDVRLDNRAELACALEIDSPVEKISDSELLLAAYIKWGEDSPKYLLGDFSYVIWDESRQELFCARDHIGVRPFYYVLQDKNFYFANDVEPLSRLENVSREISPEAIAAYFTYCQLNHPTATFFQDIKKLRPAHTMTISRNGLSVKKYWFPEVVPVLRLDGEQAYVSKLRSLLQAAIENRTLSDFPVGAHSSGGLDSSAIAVCAARYLKKGARKLNVYNWTHSPSSSEDEGDVDFEISKRLATQEGMIHHYVDFDTEDLSKLTLQHDISYNDSAVLRYEPFVRRSAKRDGIRTLLSGWGGDEFASYPGTNYAAGLFWSGQFLKAAKNIYESTKNNPGRLFLYTYMRGFMRKVLLPALPFNFYCKFMGIRLDGADLTAVLKPDWRTKVRNINMKVPGFSMLSGRRDKLGLITYGHLPTRLESWASGGMRDAIDYRYPLLDKRLIEFSLGVPDEYFERQGHQRFLYRKAVSGWLTSTDCWRPDTKYEPNRLKRLYTMEKELITLWQRGLGINLNRHNNLVDEEAVVELLRGVANEDSELDTNRFDNQVSMLLLAIYCSKLGGESSDKNVRVREENLG